MTELERFQAAFEADPEMSEWVVSPSESVALTNEVISRGIGIQLRLKEAGGAMVTELMGERWVPVKVDPCQTKY